MRTITVFACVIAMVCFGGVAYAIEGGAATIDTLGIEATSFDRVGTVAGTLDSEVAVDVPSEDWSVLAGISYRSVDPKWRENNLEGWGGQLGVKYYFTRTSSLALLGGLEQYDVVASKNVKLASLAFEQRFMPARLGVSPFVNAAFSLRFPEYEIADPADHKDHDCVIKLGAGCDFMITKTLAIQFGFNYRNILNNLNLGDKANNDGWTGTVGFVGYWD